MPLTTNISALIVIGGSYWNSSANEVRGGVFDSNGKVLHCLFGKWHEGLYCGVPPAAKCVWRPGSMPKDFELCYGFTKFAIELNELDEATKPLLHSTDTRFRPDQRLLEQGDIEGASEKKHQIEEIQRVHRRCIEESCLQYQPCFFQKVVEADGKESWVTNNTYWKLRKDPGFSQLDNPLLCSHVQLLHQSN
uniref:oxysterol-binding protein-related protein 6-like n=1 Tax=Myxine glutinosa TaxID=7769 RepID=UPI00358DE933